MLQLDGNVTGWPGIGGGGGAGGGEIPDEADCFAVSSVRACAKDSFDSLVITALVTLELSSKSV